MDNDPKLHHRRSIRLQEYDYTQAGAYFVTICTQDRACLFGNIIDHTMHLNEAGQMVTLWYSKLAEKFPNIGCDEYVIMPNHMHFIIILVEPKNSPSKAALSEIVQWFKTMTTNENIRGVKAKGWTRFKGKLWQRNYWEHVIRSEEQLNEIRQYIQNNPAQWELDQLNTSSRSE